MRYMDSLNSQFKNFSLFQMSFVRVGKGTGAAGISRKKKPVKKKAWDVSEP